MTTKGEAFRAVLSALQSLEGIGKFPNEVPAIAASREALAQKDEPHRGIPIDEYLARVYENPRRKAALERARERWEKLGEEEKAERPQKDEQEPDYKALWEQMCERCDYLDKIAHELQTLCDVQALRLGEHENRKPLTDEGINEIADSMPGGIAEFMKGWGWQQFARAIEAAHGIGADYERR